MSGSYPAPNETNLTRLCRSIRDLFEGRSNAMGGCTLRANEATTTVTHSCIGPESRIVLFPTHADAAAEMAGGNMYISAKAQGSFVITHANDPSASRTFDYVIQG
jgi:hypothetical protein